MLLVRSPGKRGPQTALDRIACLTTAPAVHQSRLELRLDVERLAVGCIHECEDRHVSRIPAVHGLVTNLALGVTTLLERQTSHRHLIFGPAIGTFEDDHDFTDDVERPATGERGGVLLLGKSIIEKAPELP